MKLNIYEKGQIIKTYTAEADDISYGVAQDVQQIIDYNRLQEAPEVEGLNMLIDVLKTKTKEVYTILKETFDGLTDNEIRKIKPREITAALIDILNYTYSELAEGMTGSEKN